MSIPGTMGVQSWPISELSLGAPALRKQDRMEWGCLECGFKGSVVWVLL